MKENGTRKKTNFFILTVFLFCVGFMLVSILPALALQPPRPGEIEQLKAEGKFQKRLDKALKLGNHKVAPYLIEKAKRKYKKDNTEANELSEASSFTSASLFPPEYYKNPLLPSTGSPRTFALLIAFSDEPNTLSQAEMQAKLYGSGRPEDYPLESLANFYDRSSHGLLNLRNGSTLGWYTTPYPRDAVMEGYTEDEEYLAREALIKEALNYYENQGHDFSQYDNDGDGMIDYFMVFWTGKNNGFLSFWWGYQTRWQDETYLLDGKNLGSYSWQYETITPGVEYDMNVVIHETGHALGLPDLYDYEGQDGSGVDEGGVGSFDIMAGGADHNCFSKWLLDWVEPSVISEGYQNLTLNVANTHGECLLVWPGASLEDIFSEYFLVQNRQNVANDSNQFYFEPDGLAVWHIDATLDEYGEDFANNNTKANPKLVRIMEADGLEEIESIDSVCIDPPENRYTDPWGACSLAPSTECADDRWCHTVYNQDLYNEGDAFTPETFPSSNKYDGSESCVRIWGIDDLGDYPGAAISAQISISCDCPASGAVDIILPADGGSDVSQTPTLNWTWASDSVFYDVQICYNSTCTAVVAAAKPTANYWVLSEELYSNFEYWWRVRANGVCGYGDWGPVWNFTTGCDSPDLTDPPELIEPADEETDLGAAPNLRWTRVPDATLYQVIVFKNQNPSQVVRSATINSDNEPAACQGVDWSCWDVSPSLEVGTYGWMVRAMNGCNTSEWSSPNTFSLMPQPVLTYPYSGAQFISLQPSFEWESMPGAAGYNIQLCNNEACSSVYQTGSVTSPNTEWQISSPKLAEEMLYYWRGRMKNSDFSNNNGPWSSVREFTTCTSPDTAELPDANPTEGAVDVTIPATLSWGSVSGSNISFNVTVWNYCSYYDDEWVCNDLDILTEGIDVGTQWTIDQPLDPETDYWWQVWVNHTCGTDKFPIQKFITGACPWVTTKKPYPEQPLDGEEVSTTPTLEWGYPFGQIFVPKEVVVCSDMECSTVVASATVSGDVWTVDSPLAAQTQYWWRVRFVNECGAPWSYVYTFMTEGAVDADGDGIANGQDNCPVMANPEQIDIDGDGTGDVCDSDADGDGADDRTEDNCPDVPNGPDRGTCTAGTVGELCGPDASCVSHCEKNKISCLLSCFGDMRCQDQCLDDYDVCMADCPTLGCGLRGFCSQAQEDADSDGLGDTCDLCPDGDDGDSDGLCDTNDNCPDMPNGPALGTCTTGNVSAPCSEKNITVCQSGCGKTLQSCQLSCSPGDITCQETCITDHEICTDECDDGCGLRGFCSQAQEDADGNGLGDACDICNDTDSDGVCDDDDNCLEVANGPEVGTCLEGDVGTPCSMANYAACEGTCRDIFSGCLMRCLPGDLGCQDRCQSDYARCLQENCDYGCGTGAACSLDQEDADGDGTGDVCESCSDKDVDGVCDDDDNCSTLPNGPERGICTSGNTGEECGNGPYSSCVGSCEVLKLQCLSRCFPLDISCQDQCQLNYIKCTRTCDDGCGPGGFCSQAQEDEDGDGDGDACDACSDLDGDGVCDSLDNCPYASNNNQADSDGDGDGDACDACSDLDADGICDKVDNCPNSGNTAQEDVDNDGNGDTCDSCSMDPDNDVDKDRVCGDIDNCPYLSNPDQNDSDGDGIGDACEVCNDIDADGVCDNNDNCPNIPNVAQQDSDADGIGDLCDETPGCGGCGQHDCEEPGDADTDGILDPVDNCLLRCNSQQLDADGDGIGDVCDSTPGCNGSCGQPNCEKEC